MVVAIAGAHGQIAMRLTSLLVGDGQTVIGLIRNPDHAAELGEQGASPKVCDLERATVQEVATAITGADVAVFAAGAGPGSGAERKLTMDRDGAIKLLEAAQMAGTRRYVIVSAVGAENPPEGNEVFSVYLRAKAEADEAIMASQLEWTVVRPGRLLSHPGSGRVRLESTPFRGEISREDVAAVLARLLSEPRAAGRTIYVNGGEEPIDEALQHALSA